MIRGFVIVCITVGLLTSTAEAINRPAMIDRALSYFQTIDALDQSWPHVKQALKRRKQEITIPPEQFSKMEGLAQRIYRKHNLYSVFKVTYDKEMKQIDLDALIKWMASPVGRKLEIAYKEASVAGEEGKRLRHFEGEGRKLLDANRRNSIKTFMKLSGQVETYTTIHTGTYFGVLMGLNAFRPATGRDAVKYLKGKAYEQKSGFIQRARDYWMVFDVYLFKDLSRGEIDEATAFVSSIAGQAHVKAYAKAVEVSMNSAASTYFRSAAGN